MNQLLINNLILNKRIYKNKQIYYKFNFRKNFKIKKIKLLLN